MPPTLLRKKGLQACLLLALLLAFAPASVDARSKKEAAAEDDKKDATEQYDELPPSSPPAWKGKIGA